MSQRDYKRNSTAKSKEKAPLPGWVWMVIGLVVGLFIAFLVYLQQQGGIKLPTTAAKSTATDTRAVKQEKPQAAPEKPKEGIEFDFYNLLPEMEVVIPEEELKEKRAPKERASYLLQVGSFSRREDAEALKAQLLLLNFTPSIQTVSVDGNRTFHRVRVGPFTSRRDLSRASNRLHENEIEFITLRAKAQDN